MCSEIIKKHVCILFACCLSKLLHCFIAVRFLFLCEKTFFLLIQCFQDFFSPLHSQNLSICVCACMCMHLYEDKYARICTSTGVHSSVGGQVCTHLWEGGCARICASAGVHVSRQTTEVRKELHGAFSLSLPLPDFWSLNAAFRLAYQALTTDPSLRHRHDVNNVSSQSFLNPSQLISSVAPC